MQNFLRRVKKFGVNAMDGINVIAFSGIFQYRMLLKSILDNRQKLIHDVNKVELIPL